MEYLGLGQDLILGNVNLAEAVRIDVFVFLGGDLVPPLVIVLVYQVLHLELDSCFQAFVVTKFDDGLEDFIDEFECYLFCS